MIAYEDIKDMTNEEAAQYFGSLTGKKILCGDLENLLNWGGYANRNSVSGAWEGGLIDFMVDPPTGAEALAEGLDELFTHLNQPRSVTVDTTSQPWAGKMELLLNGLVLAGAIAPDFMYDVIDLGGGQPNNGIDFQAIRDGAAEAALYQANCERHATLFNEHVAPVLGDGPLAIQEGLTNMAANWSE